VNFTLLAHSCESWVVRKFCQFKKKNQISVFVLILYIPYHEKNYTNTLPTHALYFKGLSQFVTKPEKKSHYNFWSYFECKKFIYTHLYWQQNGGKYHEEILTVEMVVNP